MKIAKALKLKNRLAGEISRLKTIVQTHNSQDVSRESVYDVSTIVNETLPQRIGQLVLIKTSIACSNAGQHELSEAEYVQTPYWAIFMIAELKGLIETFRLMDTKNGSFQENRAFSAVEPKPTVYVAAFKQGDVDAVIAQAEKTIDTFQDHLDTHNAVTSLDLLDDISI